MSEDLVYLDWAATAGRRPPGVAAAVTAFLETGAATPGRGSHRLAVEAGRTLLRCRQRLARLLDVPGDPGRIAFTFNATHALNAAIHGVLRGGDIMVVTDLDHNSVRRPAHLARRQRGAEIRRVRAYPDGRIDAAEFGQAVRGARLVSLNAASNVLGTVLDLEPLIRTARKHGALTLVDAAQLAGHAPLDVASSGADMVAFTGHKSLLGPHGTGALWVRAGIDIDAWMTGGTGGDSASAEMPAALPDRIEAGSANAPGLAGLEAALAWLEQRTVPRVAADAAARCRQLHDGLAGVREIRVRTPRTASLPIVCFTADSIDASTFAHRLDREHGVLTRAGLHCAPDVHRVIGTADTGAVRLSAGWATTEAEIERAVQAVRAVAAGSGSTTVVAAGVDGGGGR